MYPVTGSNMPTTKRQVDTNGPDFYPTPAWATHALMDVEHFDGSIWEPACGDGSMARVIEQYTIDSLLATDLYDRCYGRANIDFLKQTHRVDNIITNPPFHLAEDFVHAAWRCTNKKFAFLLRLAFLESAQRYNTIYSKYPPSRVHVFTERITFYPGGVQTGGSGTTAYAWFVWDKSVAVDELTHLQQTELYWIAPGMKANHTK